MTTGTGEQVALTLSDIRAALADQLRAGIAREVNVYAYKPPAPQFPCLALVAASGDYVTYTETFDRVASVDLIVEVHIAAFKVDEQMALDDFLSAGTGNNSSVVDAVREDTTLGGVVEMCEIRSAQGPSLDERDPDPLMARIPIKIYCLTEF